MILKKPSKRRFKYTKKRHSKKRHSKKRYSKKRHSKKRHSKKRYSKKRHSKKRVRYSRRRNKGSSVFGNIGDIISYPSLQNIKVNELSYGSRAGSRNISPGQDESGKIKISLNTEDDKIIITGPFKASKEQGRIEMKQPLIEKLDSLSDIERYIIYSSEHNEEGPEIHYRINFHLDINDQSINQSIYKYLPQDIGERGRRFFFSAL